MASDKKFTNICNLVIYEAHVYKTNIYFVLKCNIKLAVIPDLLYLRLVFKVIRNIALFCHLGHQVFFQACAKE